MIRKFFSKPKVKKAVKRAATACGWALGAALALVLLMALMPDAAPGGDEELLVTSLPKVPAARNSHPLLAKLEKAVKVDSKQDLLVKACAEGEPCDPAVAAIVARNGEAIRLLDSFRGKNFAPPEWSDLSKISFLTPVPQFINVMKASSLSLAQARLLAKRGRKAEALERIVRVAEAGRSLQNAPLSLIAYIVGQTMRTRALRLVPEALAGQSPAAYKAAVARLGEPEAARAGLQHAFRIEYTVHSRTLASYGLSRLATGASEPDRLKDWLGGLFFKPQRTRRMLMKEYQDLVARAAGPCPMTRPAMPEVRLWTHPELLSGNAVGLILHQSGMADFSRIISHRCEDEFLTGAARLALARRGGVRLSKAPEDPFTGQPLKLDKGGGVYSAGKDRNDAPLAWGAKAR